MDFWRIAALMLLITVHLNLANSEDKIPLVTQTVYGFLDFTTTMGNTVMVFSPQSAPPLVLPEVTTTPQPIIKTKPVNSDPEPTETDISPTKSKPTTTTNNNNSEVAAATTTTTTTTSSSSSSSSSSTAVNAEEKTVPLMDKTKTTTATTKSVAVKKKQNNSSPIETTTTTTTTTTTNNAIVNSEKDTTPLTNTTLHHHQPTSPIPIENDLYSPEYNLLSRQPPQFVEESFRVISLRQPPSHNKLSRPSPSPPPVVVTPEKNTVSSVVATKNLSTRTHKNKKHKVRPSSTLQVLKTAAPISAKSSSGKRASAPRSSSSSSSRKSGKKGSHRTTTTTIKPQVADNVVTVRSNTRTKPKSRKSKHKSSSHGSKPKYATTTTATIQEPTSKRAFRPKTPNHNPIDLDNNNNSNNNNNNNNNLHITKLNRAPGRWQYKTTPKPRVTIRKPLVEGVNNAGTLAGVVGVAGAAGAAAAAGLANISLVNAVTESLFNDNVNNNFIINNQSDLESSGSQSGGAIVNNIDGDGGNSIGPDGKQKFFTETINVEISTPADFQDTYYEIATIKKPFIFQAGILKKTRYITVTSTIEKYLTSEVGLEPRNEDEPLTENILATTSQSPHTDNLLQGSITTLSPIYVNNDAETPLLETITDSFSIVNKKLKTQILPVIKVGMENETSYNTLIQTIDVTSLITITKTTSPLMESKDGFNGFKDFVDNLDEAGSEINLDLEFGDENNHESNGEDRKFKNSSDLDQLMAVSKVNKTILPVLPITADIPSFVQSTLPLPTVITNSRPVIKLETLWESYVIPVTNGQSTTFRTLSKAKGVVEKTEYVLDATTVPVQPTPILPPNTLNPFLLPIQQQQQQLQQYQTITSPVVQQTIVTQTQSKILKLTFGAKTAYTTLYSTQVVPTLQTMYVTTSLPVQASANPFPGFFPPGYNPFAYLG